MTERPDWPEYFLAGTEWVATRADCTRRKVGAVIVRDNRIVATGYNGGQPGGPSCLAGECPRGRFTKEELPGAHDPNPSSYDVGPGTCIAIHAEQNAIMYCSRDERIGAIMYVSCEPCTGCFRMIAGSGLYAVIWPAAEDGKVHFRSFSGQPERRVDLTL